MIMGYGEKDSKQASCGSNCRSCLPSPYCTHIPICRLISSALGVWRRYCCYDTSCLGSHASFATGPWVSGFASNHAFPFVEDPAASEVLSDAILGQLHEEPFNWKLTLNVYEAKQTSVYVCAQPVLIHVLTCVEYWQISRDLELDQVYAGLLTGRKDGT